MLTAPLPVLSEIRQHREQHEAADEGHSLIQRQTGESCAEAPGVGNTPIAVNGGGTDGFDALKQGITAVAADHITQDLAEKADIGVLGQRYRRSAHRPILIRPGATGLPECSEPALASPR